MSGSFDVSGMTAKLKTIRVTSAEAAARGLFRAAEHVLQVSGTLVPLEDGTLRRSGKTSLDAGKLRAAVSYSAPYSVRQHEEMDYQHDAGRTAKYLEGPLNTEVDTCRKIINEELRRGWKP